MSETVQANDGAMLPLSSLPTQLTYEGTFISKLTVIYADRIYNQTFTNDGTNIIYISGWNTDSAPISQINMTDESGDLMIAEDGNIMVTE